MKSAPDNYQLPIVIVLILAAANALAEPVTVQKSASRIDDQGCLNFEATARVEQPIDDLYGAMSRPEALWMSEAIVTPQVFVGFPWSQQVVMDNRANSFSTTRPFSKIVELTAHLGRSGPEPRRWIEYRFDGATQTIWQDDIGSTTPLRIYPEFRVTYSLAPSDDKSATSVRYTSRRCFAPEESKTADQKRMWTESEKDLMTSWLTAANAECERVRAEPSPVASAVATPISSPPGPAVPTDTPTPRVLP